jgi:hypothetical protein
VIAAAAVWYATTRWSVRAKALLVAAVVVVGLGAGLLRVRQLSADPDFRGAGFRQQFNASSLRMIGIRPWAGVGVGQYFATSPLVLSPQLAFSYGAENAHNYFLQFAAELGIPGLAVLIVWLGIGIVRAGRALLVDSRDARLLGMLAGVVALLGTSMTGHPLLVDEVAYPFWMYYGLMLGLAGSTLFNEAEGRGTRASHLATVAAAVAVIVLSQALLRPELRPSEDRSATGLFEWETDADGVRYRWTGDYGSVFVPADVTRVYIPVRMPAVTAGLSPMGIEVKTTAAPGERIVVGDRWAIINLDLPDAVPPTRFKRINLKVDRAWQPALYVPGSGDLRSVGVQVGEVRHFREH